MAGSKWTIVFGILISEPKEETGTRGKSYNFSLLNESIIRSSWEIGHKFVLKNPNQVRPMEFERIFRGLL